jgi:hypothetical protein
MTVATWSPETYLRTYRVVFWARVPDAHTRNSRRVLGNSARRTHAFAFVSSDYAMSATWPFQVDAPLPEECQNMIGSLCSWLPMKIDQACYEGLPDVSMDDPCERRAQPSSGSNVSDDIQTTKVSQRAYLHRWRRAMETMENNSNTQ